MFAFYEQLERVANSTDSIALEKFKREHSSRNAASKDNYALRAAAEDGNARALKCLRIRFGLTADDARARDNYALRSACAFGHTEVLEELRNGWGLTGDDARTFHSHALYLASRYGHATTLAYLHTGFGLTGEDARAHNSAALQDAAYAGHLSVLKCLREVYGLTSDDARAINNSALRLAAENGHAAVLEYLRAGFNLTTSDALAGNGYALRQAAKNGHVEVLKCLRTAFGAPNAAAENSNITQTVIDALEEAIADGRDDIAQELSAHWLLDSVLDAEFYRELGIPEPAGSISDSECAICICTMVASHCPGATLTVTGCGHVFHTSCISRAITRDCPMCRGLNMVASENALIIAPTQYEPRNVFATRLNSAVAERRRPSAC